MTTQPIGSPSYGSVKSNHTTSRLKEGSNIYRILPPFGKLASDGRWAVYDSIHWGYKSSKGIRTFRCIQKKDNKTKMIKQSCPECDLIAARKKDHDEQFKTLTETNKMSPDDAREFLKPLSGWLRDHNLDKKWYLNALSPAGEIVRLAIPHKMYQSLMEVIQELLKMGVDPIAANKGVFLNFKRTGMGLNTVHRCTVEKETFMVDGQPAERIKLAPLTEETLNKMQQEGWDLSNMFRDLPDSEIQRLINGNGDTDVVDSVFANPGDADEPSPEELSASTMVVAPTPVAKPAPVVVAPPAPVVAAPVVVAAPAPVVDEMAALRAELAAMKAAAAKPAPVAAPVVVPEVVKPPVAKTEKTNADFMAQFGPKKV